MLFDKHKQDLYSSGINDEFIKKYNFTSLTINEATKLLGFLAPSSGWLIRYPKSDFLKFKPDSPINPKTKYLSPKGMSQDLFVTQTAELNINNNNVPYVFVEGEKKGIALEQCGYAAIAVAGVWNWKSRGHSLTILSQINLKVRLCFIIFDSDKYNNKHVLEAEKQFAQALMELGAIVRIIDLNPEYGKGADDQLIKMGIDNFRTYFDQARGVEDNHENKEVKGFGVIPIGKIKSKRIKWLIKDIVPCGVLTFITAMPKAGKSTFAINMAVRLSSNLPFLGKYALGRRKPFRVIVVSLEDHEGEVKAKVQSFLHGRRFPNKYLSMLKAHSISLPNDFKRLKIDIQNEKPDVVILDTLRRSHQCEEDSSSALAPIINGLRELIREFNFTGIVIHHTGHKVIDLNSSGNWLRGSSDLNAAWETLIALEKKKEVVKVRVFHKYRSGLEFDYKVIKGQEKDPITGDFPIIDLVYSSPNDSLNKEIDDKVISYLKEGKKSGNEIENFLKDKGKVSRQRIDESLDRLNQEGKIKQEGKGRNAKWYLVSK